MPLYIHAHVIQVGFQRGAFTDRNPPEGHTDQARYPVEPRAVAGMSCRAPLFFRGRYLIASPGEEVNGLYRNPVRPRRYGLLECFLKKLDCHLIVDPAVAARLCTGCPAPSARCHRFPPPSSVRGCSMSRYGSGCAPRRTASRLSRRTRIIESTTAGTSSLRARSSALRPRMTTAATTTTSTRMPPPTTNSHTLSFTCTCPLCSRNACGPRTGQLGGHRTPETTKAHRKAGFALGTHLSPT